MKINAGGQNWPLVMRFPVEKIPNYVEINGDGAKTEVTATHIVVTFRTPSQFVNWMTLSTGLELGPKDRQMLDEYEAMTATGPVLEEF